MDFFLHIVSLFSLVLSPSTPAIVSPISVVLTPTQSISQVVFHPTIMEFPEVKATSSGGVPTTMPENIENIFSTIIVTPAPTIVPTPMPTMKPTNTPIPTSTPTPTSLETPEPTPTASPSPSPFPTPQPVTSNQLDSWFTQYSQQYSIDRQKLWNIAVCESDLRPNAKNGDYGGMYQFSASTWSSTRRAMNADPNPDLRFSAEESIKTAAFKISTVGLAPWPSCSK